MGLLAWLKGFVRQVVEDDLEGTGASRPAEAPAEGRPASTPLVSEHDLGAGSSGAAPPQDAAAAHAAADEEDAEAAAAWVVHSGQGKGGGGRE